MNQKIPIASSTSQQLADIANVTNIKQSKLFKKFIETEITEESKNDSQIMVSSSQFAGTTTATPQLHPSSLAAVVAAAASSSHSSPHRRHANPSAFQYSSGNNPNASNSNRGIKRGGDNNNKPTNLASSNFSSSGPLQQQQHQQLIDPNISATSSELPSAVYQQHLSHSYFEPPSAHHHRDNTMTSLATSQLENGSYYSSPLRNRPMNNAGGAESQQQQQQTLSNLMLDSLQKQRFSPERFYFNPPVNSNHRSQQTPILEEDEQPDVYNVSNLNPQYSGIEQQSPSQQFPPAFNNSYSQQAQNVSTRNRSNHWNQQNQLKPSRQHSVYEQQQHELQQQQLYLLQQQEQEYAFMQQQQQQQFQQQQQQQQYIQQMGMQQNQLNQIYYSQSRGQMVDGIDNNPMRFGVSSAEKRVNFAQIQQQNIEVNQQNKQIRSKSIPTADFSLREESVLAKQSSDEAAGNNVKQSELLQQLHRARTITDSTTASIAEAAKKNRQLEAQIVDLTQELQEQRGSLESANAAADRAKSINLTLENSLAEAKRKIAALEAEKRDSKSLLDGKHESQKSEITQLNQKVNEGERRENQLKGELEKMKGVAGKEENAKKKFEDDIKALTIKFKEVCDQNTELQRKVTKKEDETNQLSLLNESLKAKLNQLSFNYERNVEKLTDVQRSHLREGEEKDDLSRQLSEVQMRGMLAVNDNDRLKGELSRTLRELHESVLENQMLRSDTTSLNARVAELMQRNQVQAVNLDSLSLENHALKAKVFHSKTEIKTAFLQISRLKESVAELTARLPREQFEIGSKGESETSSVSQKEYSQSLLENERPAALDQFEQPQVYKSIRSGVVSTPAITLQRTLQQQQQQEKPRELSKYTRGRIASQLNPETSQKQINQLVEISQAEEAKLNSPPRYRHRPQDTLVLGSGIDEPFSNPSMFNATSSHKYSQPLSQTTRAGGYLKQKESGLFSTKNGVAAAIAGGDAFQRNPAKIGFLSVSPPPKSMKFVFESKDELPPAGVSKGFSTTNPLQQVQQNQQTQMKRIYEAGKTLQQLNADKTALENEERRLEDLKWKSGADQRQKAEVKKELRLIDEAISQMKTMQLR